MAPEEKKACRNDAQQEISHTYFLHFSLSSQKKYVASLLQPPLLDLVGHLADGERPPAAAARVDGVGHHVVLGFPNKKCKKYIKIGKNRILTGTYFYLDSEPLPDLDPQADHGGEAGEFQIVSLMK